MRILLLCNNYHPLSIACLRALHAVPLFEISVGLVGPKECNIGRLSYKMFRRYGFAEALQRGIRFGVSQARLAGRRWGLSFEGFGTVREFLQVHELERIQFDDINSPEAVSAVRQRNFDLLVAGGFSQILRSKILSIPRLGALNVHLSLFPKFRGPCACYWVVKTKEATTGVTIHFMDPHIDTGDIVLQQPTAVLAGESATQMERRLSAIAARLLPDAIRQVADGTARRQPQRHEEASYYSFPRSA